MKCDLYPGSKQIPAMLINKAPNQDKLEAILSSKDYFGQVKKDGFWYELEKTPEGNIYLFSRSKSKKTGELSEKIDHVPHIKKWAEGLPNGTVLIGEIYYPGKTSKDVTKIMGSLAEKAVSRQNGEYGLLHYYIHDMIYYANEDMRDMPFEKRFSDLCKYIDLQMPSEDWLEIAPVFENYDTNHQMADTISRLLSEGEEGAVLKKKDGIYQPGKRPTYNIKIKKEMNNIDVVVMDFLDPEKYYYGKCADEWQYKDEEGKLLTKPYYYGWKNGFYYGAYNEEGKLVQIGKVSSGLTDEIRKDCSENPEKWIGSVIELQAMSADKDELSLRHSRFIRLREDKNVTDCKMEDIF